MCFWAVLFKKSRLIKKSYDQIRNVFKALTNWHVINIALPDYVQQNHTAYQHQVYEHGVKKTEMKNIRRKGIVKWKSIEYKVAKQHLPLNFICLEKVTSQYTSIIADQLYCQMSKK